MSYVRFHWGGSDLYVFESVYGGLECCGCRLNERGFFSTTDPGEFIRHIQEHELVGHVVRPGLAWDIWRDWRDGEFDHTDDDEGSDMEPFDPDFPEPANATEEERVAWNREVMRDLGWLGPIFGKPQINRDGTPYESHEEWRERMKREKEQTGD